MDTVAKRTVFFLAFGHRESMLKRASEHLTVKNSCRTISNYHFTLGGHLEFSSPKPGGLTRLFTRRNTSEYNDPFPLYLLFSSSFVSLDLLQLPVGVYISLLTSSLISFFFHFTVQE